MMTLSAITALTRGDCALMPPPNCEALSATRLF